ncbi:DUF444 family protein [Duganella sp. LX20W]|uniref:DUF444 family protein n=1 Tax=Rugamonas brunnea TaxID=2758569 RepID=A0A7W2ICE8_9BURK|nr:DUF444 family protein [Rugamonas brunnea]MBA5638279.1 DUF444 family protein [Rugamonas brunnea]
MAQADARGWYGLFARGARDWLRHNEKLREAVSSQLPDLAAVADAITSDAPRAWRVSTSQLELARLRLAQGPWQTGAGHGPGQPGELLREAGTNDGVAADGGSGDGAIHAQLDIAMDDVIDWLWEAFQLPDLQACHEALLTHAALERDGWNQRGARSRLDRRRTLAQAVKRRAVQPGGPAFTNEDLRFRQLARRPRLADAAAVFFVLDASASMTGAERRLAKTFFFLALRGLRRQYRQVAIRFIAHTTHAWEFAERDFFQVSGEGGTVASTAFELALACTDTHYRGNRPYRDSGPNCYLYYASDGENFSEDRVRAGQLLSVLCTRLNFLGYVETLPGLPRAAASEMTRLCAEQARLGRPIGCARLASPDDVWPALRSFFMARPPAGVAM